jgi:hypothetical protein
LPERGARERIGEFSVSDKRTLAAVAARSAARDRVRRLRNDNEEIEEAPKALPDNHVRDPVPDSPLFPLLPSVQIFLAAFC